MTKCSQDWPYSANSLKRITLGPGATPLKDARAAVDAAVLASYGFTTKKDSVAQLPTLNPEVAANIEKGELVAAPAVPENYLEAKPLVTEDCFRLQG
jgi:hypothetical protein